MKVKQILKSNIVVLLISIKPTLATAAVQGCDRNLEIRYSLSEVHETVGLPLDAFQHVIAYTYV